jgi:S-adenosylmethionine:tRNA ribosyltransferase-isomerase
MSDKIMSVDSYDFFLPEELIAQSPAESREESRLLVLNGGETIHKKFYEITEFLKEGDVIIRNTTKVFPARLIGKRSGGGKAEILLLREIEPLLWECMIRPSARLPEGRCVSFDNSTLTGEIKRKLGGGRAEVFFNVDSPDTFWKEIYSIGKVPLPPYIKREDNQHTEEDVNRYQTVYADKVGAVAAPTAGLHFTDKLFSEIEKMGVTVCDLVLHVGLGTFLPVKADNLSDHKMHVEHYEISQATANIINVAKAEGRSIISVGTTATRALEASASESGKVSGGKSETDIFIYPGYDFKVIDGMITNFHLPKSTLFMLVSALYGRERMLSAYGEAIENKYRFYSYGDAMLILP